MRVRFFFLDALEITMNAPFEYVFPAIRGIQAKREYFVSMCPLRLIPKLFFFDEEELEPELRAQRTLNKNRIPEMAHYMVSNRDDYVFSALTASIDADITFEPLAIDTEARRIGLLHVPMSARFIINDGQHRRAAIQEALHEKPGLGDETIAIVLFLDKGLERCQQMFADLNRYAIRPSKSLGVLYDHRDEMAKLAKLVVLKCDAFKNLVEMEKTNLAKRSRRLFTLSAIYAGILALFEGEKPTPHEELSHKAIAFWEEVAKYLPEWKLVKEGKMSAAEVRNDFIHSHGIVLQALGRMGHQLFLENAGSAWKKKLRKLATIDWSRTNTRLWEGRTMNAGRVSKAGQHVTLTTNAIKKHLGLSLLPEEERTEQAFLRNQTSGN
jgi:DNA sulfur modification protein DndB